MQRLDPCALDFRAVREEISLARMCLSRIAREVILRKWRFSATRFLVDLYERGIQLLTPMQEARVELELESGLPAMLLQRINSGSWRSMPRKTNLIVPIFSQVSKRMYASDWLHHRRAEHAHLDLLYLPRPYRVLNDFNLGRLQSRTTRARRDQRFLNPPTCFKPLRTIGTW